MPAYRILLTAVLRQDSALSVGGSDDEAFADEAVARDGTGEPVVRGETLAGALIATMRKLYREVPAQVSSGLPDEQAGEGRNGGGRTRGLVTSCVRVYNAHPRAASDALIDMHGERQGVGIRHDTGAAAEGVLYDLETLPRGIEWPILIDIDMLRLSRETSRTGRPQLSSQVVSMVLAALEEWRNGRCWIGRSAARGLGWMTLDELEAYPLECAQFARWPDSGVDDKYAAVAARFASQRITEPSAAAFAARLGASWHAPDKPWHYVEITATLGAGESEYGLDTLRVGGHSSDAAHVGFNPEHWLKPSGMTEKSYETLYFNPDMGFVMTPVSRSRKIVWEPYIPGSAIRGSLRAALSRRSRQRGVAVRDPHIARLDDCAGEALDPVETIFGRVAHHRSPGHGDSARLLICDAYLIENEPQWRAAQFSSHAEDEFTAGVYASGLYQRAVLVKSRFALRMIIECEERQSAEDIRLAIEPIVELAKLGHLPIGAGAWHGSGWLAWKDVRFTDVDRTRVGADAQHA